MPFNAMYCNVTSSRNMLCKHLDVNCSPADIWHIDLEAQICFRHKMETAVNQRLIEVKHQGLLYNIWIPNYEKICLC